MKKILFVLLIAALLPFKMKGEWVPLDNKRAPETAPKITILSDDNNSTVIKIELAGFDLKGLAAEGKNYDVVDLLTETFSEDPGNPQLPCISKILAVPDQAGISVEVLETGNIQVFKDVNLPPVRKSWYEGTPESTYEENTRAYQSNEIYPDESVRVEPPAIFRDFRIARISVFPVRYVAARKELQVVSSMTVRVNYGKGEVVNPKTTPRRAIAASFGKIYRSFIFNYQDVLETLYGGRETGRELILCIMPDIFVESFQVYADWKRQSGIDVHVTKFSDIGANANNPDIIKDYIADAYHNWEIPPTYVLIVGDDGVFPKKIVTYPDYSFPDEDYFVEIDGNDYFPELMIGRWTNQGDYRMQVMIDKFLLYEKNPFTDDPTWFKKATVCANNEYASQPETKRFTYHKMKDVGGFTSVDTLMSNGDPWGGGCTVDLTDVVNAINNGRSFLNYRGEGWYEGWYANCYSFTVPDVSGLNNGQKFTFVTSIGCGVAGFDYSGGNCFGEEWVEEGSELSPRGACAFIGPTSNTHTQYNNAIDRGIYIGMFDEGLDTPGEALLRGKLFMYQTFGNEYYVEYHYKIYCVLGDPSIHIWKEKPREVTVDYRPSIPVGDNNVEFTVKFPPLYEPVANALVCVTGDTVFSTGYTDSTGVAHLSIQALTEDTLTVTVTGGYVYPFQGTMVSFQYDVYVEPDGEPVVVDLDGNTDGLINPNEHCNITYKLKNWGTQTAFNVQAALTSADTDYVEILSTDPVSFGNLAPGDTATGNPFEFYVKPNCPVGQIINLQLDVTSDTNSWEYPQEELIKGCVLDYKNFAIFDPSSGQMNFRMDPGENDVVVLSIKNDGQDFATDVMGILISDDPYITITDSVGYFGPVAIGGIAKNMENVFMARADASCPTNYMANYSLKLFTQNGNYPYQRTIDFQIPVSKLITTDYTGPDAYGYYAYSSDDSFYDQTPVYNWFELRDLGTQIILPQSDFTTTLSLPFTFKYYGHDNIQIRVSTDGWMAFGSGSQTAPVNYALPHQDNINNMVAPFWDDLYDELYWYGNIYYYNDVLNHRFIVEWDSISRNNYSTEPVREYFQAILLDPAYYTTQTGDGEIIFQYEKLDDFGSCTIGIENQAQDIGLQYVYNNNYDPTASFLSNELAIKFTTEPPFTNILTSVEDPAGKKPDHADYGLVQNHPNPFNSSTEIDYSIPEAAFVTLNIYDITGELVCTLHNGKQSPGLYSVKWNGLNSWGKPVSAGVYFCRLTTENYSGTIKMFVLR
jgi:hypothetical protein